MNILLILSLSIFLTWFLTKLLIKPFKRFIPDLPNKRSAHHKLKPRGGGISFILINFVLAIIFSQKTFFFLLPLSIVSFLDDFFNLSKFIRLFTQILTSFYLFLISPYFDSLILIDNITLKIFLISIILVASTAIINFCNFVDGIDGILTGSVLVVLISFSFLIDGNVWPLIGSLIGFLLWNWEPSKIFMGDIGSNFLGGVLVWILLNSGSVQFSFCFLLISFPILIDPLTCLIRRFINKQNIFEAHSLHLYQRLNKAGLAHNRVSKIYILSSFFISLSFFAGGLKIQILTTIFIFLLGILIDKKKAIPFK